MSDATSDTAALAHLEAGLANAGALVTLAYRAYKDGKISREDVRKAERLLNLARQALRRAGLDVLAASLRVVADAAVERARCEAMALRCGVGRAHDDEAAQARQWLACEENPLVGEPRRIVLRDLADAQSRAAAARASWAARAYALAERESPQWP